MAIQLNASKGGFSITDGYLLITMVQMTRYLKPVTVSEAKTQPDGTVVQVARLTTEPAMQYIARGQVYANAQMREDSFGTTDLNFAFAFEHTDGKDPTGEAYDYVKKNGLKDWTLTGMTDV